MTLTTIVSTFSFAHAFNIYSIHQYNMRTSHVTNVANESVADYFACILKWKTLSANKCVVADQFSSCHFDGSASAASLTGLLINWNLVSDALACRSIFTRCLNRCWQVGWVTSHRHRMISFPILIYSTICIFSMYPLCVQVIFTFPFVTTTQAGNFRFVPSLDATKDVDYNFHYRQFYRNHSFSKSLWRLYKPWETLHESIVSIFGDAQ